jgi:hypothetical protein
MIHLLALGTLLALAHPAQSVSDTELQRFVSRSRFPLGCGDARLAADAMRAHPTTDAATLAADARAFQACAASPYGTQSFALTNVSNFATAAAALLAARYAQAPAEARHDAQEAADATQTIVDFRWPAEGPGVRNVGGNPSPFITDAGRIRHDALALLAP